MSFFDKYSVLLIAAVISVEVVIMALTIKCYLSIRKKTLYSYKSASLLGGGIFMVIMLMFSIKALFIKDANVSLFQTFLNNISQTSSLFPIVVFPFMIAFFLFMSLSNISLIRHEGKTVKNILGSVLSFALIIATIAGVFGWDVIYKNVIFEIYTKGHSEIVIFDYAFPMFLTSLICYVECLLLGTIISSIKATKFKPDYNKDYIIILGCAIAKNGKPLPLLRGRIDKALQFAKEQYEKTGKMPKFVVSGGKGDDECISEAESMKNYLMSQGVGEDNILVENKSASTLENMKFSKVLIEKDNCGKNIIFSTTNYHIFRSGIYANQVGMNAQGIGSKTKWYFWPNAFVREFVALLVSRKKSHIINALFLLAISIICALANYAFVK